MNDDIRAPRLTRTAALRLAAAGAAGLALGARPARAAAAAPESIAAAARAFSRRCRPLRARRATFPFTDTERTRWHWTVPGLLAAEGPATQGHDDGAAQARAGAAAVEHLAAGYRKALDIMALQGVLQRMSTGFSDPFDPDLYYVSIFGAPGNAAWGWRLEGHHLSRHFTVVGGTSRRGAVLPRRLAHPHG